MCLTKDMIIVWVCVISCKTAYANTIQLVNINSRGFEERPTDRGALFRSLAGWCTLAVRYRSPSKPLHNLPNFPHHRCQLIKLLTFGKIIVCKWTAKTAAYREASTRCIPVILDISQEIGKYHHNRGNNHIRKWWLF